MSYSLVSSKYLLTSKCASNTCLGDQRVEWQSVGTVRVSPETLSDTSSTFAQLCLHNQTDTPFTNSFVFKLSCFLASHVSLLLVVAGQVQCFDSWEAAPNSKADGGLAVLYCVTSCIYKPCTGSSQAHRSNTVRIPILFLHKDALHAELITPTLHSFHKWEY